MTMNKTVVMTVSGNHRHPHHSELYRINVLRATVRAITETELIVLGVLPTMVDVF